MILITDVKSALLRLATGPRPREDFPPDVFSELQSQGYVEEVHNALGMFVLTVIGLHEAMSRWNL